LSNFFKHTTFFIAILSILATTAIASAQEVQVPAEVKFSTDANVREAVVNECNLQTKLPDFIRTYGKKNGVDVVLSDKALNKKQKGRVLLLEITNVNGAGGGAWSGAKSVNVKGSLYENGKRIGNFTASRYSGGGMFAAYKGTCSILGRCVKTLGSDIAKWLKNPSKDARLG